MPQTAQLVIALDANNNIICEAPGPNGQRVKVEGFTFADLPEPIQTALKVEQARLSRIQIAPSVKDRPDPEVERFRRNEEAARERKRTYDRWFASLTKQEQDIEIAARLVREEKNRNKQLETAHAAWYTTAARHSVKLANRVITDPKRRPRKAAAITQKLSLDLVIKL